VITAQTSEDELIGLIIGRTLDRMQRQHAAHHDREVVVSADSLRGELVIEASFELHRGETVGLTGLVGSGYDEVPYLLFGARQARAGNIAINGVTYRPESLTPMRAIKSGMALIPADRQREGSVTSLPATDNMTLHVLENYFNGIILDRRRMTRDAQELMRRFDVRPDDAKLVYSAFSGGNQQKALLAKWLQSRPSVLLLHEPTQGVDIGARQRIFKVIRDAAADGTCVLCASSDYDQLASICDRALIFADGRVVSELTGRQVTKDRIVEHCYSSSPTITGGGHQT
jgi:ribose transport system ATP-binding protein